MLQSERVSSPKQLPKLLISAILLPLLAATAYSQGYGDRSRLGGTGGNHTIQGRIQNPANRSVAAARVRLESPNAGTLTTNSDADGVFRFSSLEAGVYNIVIEVNEDFDVARESVYIDRETPGSTTSRVYNVVIYLRPKGSVKTKPGVINAALAEVPKSALKAFEKALESESKGNTPAAVEKLNEAISLHPQFFEAYAELGSLYLKTNQLDKAIQALHTALGINEKNHNVRLNYGVALLNKKEMTEAEKQLRMAIQSDETAATPRMYLGIALVGLNKFDEAEREFLRAISIKDDEKLAQAHRYLGGIYWGKANYRLAAEELEKYLRLAPKAADAGKIRETIKLLREK